LEAKTGSLTAAVVLIERYDGENVFAVLPAPSRQET
jgi:hypothetical protein